VLAANAEIDQKMTMPWGATSRVLASGTGASLRPGDALRQSHAEEKLIETTASRQWVGSSPKISVRWIALTAFG
jgi:hypothetical protein